MNPPTITAADLASGPDDVIVEIMLEQARDRRWALDYGNGWRPEGGCWVKVRSRLMDAR
jgi:hypothetical protein